MPPTGYVPKLHVVPTEAGQPLVPYEPPPGAPSRDRREGPASGLQFGPTDFALLVLGAALLVWALVAGLPTVVLVLASIITLVGFFLPMRKLLGRDRPNRTEPRRSDPALDGDGLDEVPLLLDLADPTSMRLAGAYRSLVAAATLHGDDAESRTALAAGHRSLRQAAELLDGRPPANLRELEEIDRRSEAIEDATASLRTV